MTPFRNDNFCWVWKSLVILQICQKQSHLGPHCLILQHLHHCFLNQFQFLPIESFPFHILIQTHLLQHHYCPALLHMPKLQMFYEMKYLYFFKSWDVCFKEIMHTRFVKENKSIGSLMLFQDIIDIKIKLRLSKGCLVDHNLFNRILDPGITRSLEVNGSVIRRCQNL